MRLMDTPLNWVLPSAVLLVSVLTGVFVLARRGGADAGDGTRDPDSASDASESPQAADPHPDTRERLAERRRRRETAYAAAAYLLLFCCAGVAAALSFHGLVGFGRQNLNLSGGWEYLVPFGLDGAAMFSAVIAVREASHGDASLGSRLLVWIFAAAAAWFNWVHAPRGEGHAGAPQFFAGMSLSAAILFDRALKQTRRAALREQGLVPRPLPRIRVVRWLRAPRETYGAWSLMLLENVRSLDEAVDEVREDRRQQERERTRRREQAKLERAHVRALGGQHRPWGRGRPPAQLAVGAGVQAQQLPPGAGHDPGPDGGTPSVEPPAPGSGRTPGGGRSGSPAPGAWGPDSRARRSRRAEDETESGHQPPKALRSGHLPTEPIADEPPRTATPAGADRTPLPSAHRSDTEDRMDGSDERPRGAGDDERSPAANPRLASLEEKLADIERQFG